MFLLKSHSVIAPIDSQVLNKIVVKNSHFLPRIADITFGYVYNPVVFAKTLLKILKLIK